MRSNKTTSLVESHGGEQGAALITTILLSMLLLAAGGILILTSTMTGITARDSTAEMQAYYAAEAGLARTLEVIRGNVPSNPAGTRASFHNIVCTTGLWTTLSGSVVNVSADGTARFQVTSILDSDNQDSVTMCAAASYKPDRLLRLRRFENANIQWISADPYGNQRWDISGLRVAGQTIIGSRSQS